MGEVAYILHMLASKDSVTEGALSQLTFFRKTSRWKNFYRENLGGNIFHQKILPFIECIPTKRFF